MKREGGESTPYEEQAKQDSIATAAAIEATLEEIARQDSIATAYEEIARQDTINAINSYRRSRRYDSIIPK